MDKLWVTVLCTAFFLAGVAVGVWPTSSYTHKAGGDARHQYTYWWHEKGAIEERNEGTLDNWPPTEQISYLQASKAWYYWMGANNGIARNPHPDNVTAPWDLVLCEQDK